jgi:hypothetical protein
MAEVLDGLGSARQIAYNAAQKNAFFKPWLREADELCRRYCAWIDVEPKPIFDERTHIAKRIAEGNQDFIEAYGEGGMKPHGAHSPEGAASRSAGMESCRGCAELTWGRTPPPNSG